MKSSLHIFSHMIEYTMHVNHVMQLVLFCYYHTSMNMIGDNLPFLNRLV